MSLGREGEGADRMRDLIEYMAKALVDEPDQVQVDRIIKGNLIVYKLRVAPEDVGRVVGRGGRIIAAMRTLLRVAAIRARERVVLEVE